MRQQILSLLVAAVSATCTTPTISQTADTPHSTVKIDPQAPVGSAKNPVRVSSGVMAGLLLAHKLPLYPVAEGPYKSGAVILHAIITPNGNVDRVSVISSPESLRQRALDAVQQWVYKPYLLNGTAVWVQTTIMMNIDFGG
ncbi:MAG: TonB family protein [Acidobacteria bacterium]|nr:TonB family protein [Acidobacteriota bacterium]